MKEVKLLIKIDTIVEKIIIKQNKKTKPRTKNPNIMLLSIYIELVNSKKWRTLPLNIEKKQQNNYFSLWNMKSDQEKICKKIFHNDGSVERIFMDRKKTEKKIVGKKRENQNNVEIWGWDCETIIFDYDEQKHINK